MPAVQIYIRKDLYDRFLKIPSGSRSALINQLLEQLLETFEKLEKKDLKRLEKRKGGE